MNRSQSCLHQTGSMGVLTASHEETAAHLSDVIEAELSAVRRSRIERHLRRCEGCRALLRSLTSTVERLRDLSRRDVPANPGLAEQVVAQLRAEPAS
jgi:predicted anti-sigma-YlaC factor YlaD